jgi:hypothetical protein
MPATYKKIAFLAPRADLDDGAFRAYWEHEHGPLVGGSPGYSAWRWRYVQDHPTCPGPDNAAPFEFSGIAEFWLPPRAPTEMDYVQSSIYRDRIAPDEDAFIDKAGTLSLRAREQVLLRGEGPVKLMRLGQWTKEFPDTRLAELRAELSAYGLTVLLMDWRVDHVMPGSTRLPGAETATGLTFDYVETLRFASEADAATHLTTAAPLRSQIFDQPATTLFVRERLFFADGVFTG